MRVAELIDHLKRANPDAPVSLAIWFGPGAPSWTPYDVAEVRVLKDERGAEHAYLCGNDFTPRPAPKVTFTINGGMFEGNRKQAKKDLAELLDGMGQDTVPKEEP